MRILYHFRVRGTGAEAVHIAGIARGFEKRGHNVHFSSPTGIDPRETAGSNPYGTGGGFFSRYNGLFGGVIFEFLEIGYNIVAWWRNSLLLRGKAMDLIYERHAFFLCATGFLARHFGIPLVVEVNELAGDERVRRQPLLGFIARRTDRWLFHRASLLVVVSPHLKRRIIEMGVCGDKILVLPNGVEAEQYRVPATGTEVRRNLGLEAESVVIGFVGWFVFWHRLDRLVEIFTRLAAQHPQLRLLLVGDGERRNELARQAEAAGLTDKVIFSGAVPHGQIPEYIAAMDICVVPHSNAYRSPIKLFEYMGQGRAVVAPATEPISTVVRDGENGILFCPDSVEALQEGLDRLCRNRTLREHIGTRARTDVMRKYTWEENARRILEAGGWNP